MRFPFFRNRDSVKNGILISIRRTGDGFHPGLFNKVISKEELLEKLWNDKYYIDENVLLVNMTRLKKKMKEIGIVHLLENIRGKGWKL